MKPVILFRKDLQNEEELEICKKHFEVYQYRHEIPYNRLVVPRYSALPFYNELEKDVEAKDSILVNSLRQHLWIANFEYYEVLKDYTFKTWFDMRDLPEDMAFVVKGVTNSRKSQWNTKMYAPNKDAAIEIYFELCQDGLIGDQGIIFREYEKLETFEIGINGLPFSNEWRFFFYKNDLISYGYYWGIAENILTEIDPAGIKFAQKVANVCKDYCNFYVLDVAKKENGEWVLVEVNDGSMSGLSCNDANFFYERLSVRLEME